MVVSSPRKNISVSLPADLVEHLDAWVKAGETNRSALLAELLRAEQRRRLDEELEQAYRELTADGFYDDIEFYLPAQAEVALANPYPSEP